MKKIYSIVALACTALLATLSFTSCSSDLEYNDVEVTAVKQLYSPKDNQKVTLVASATASLYFEWSAANASDGCAPLYEVLFDKADGDFSKPIYSLTSDDNGARAYATISHKVLDKIAALAGAGSGDVVTVKWTVRSTRGIGGKLAEESRALTITRLLGFAEIPAQLYITGEGTEVGADVAKALVCAAPEADCFEIFTKLEAGKNYQFVDARDGEIRHFYIEGSSLKESMDGSKSGQVEKTGVYRIYLDFAVASVKMVEITGCGVFFCPSNAVILEMPYVGNGVWEGTGATPFKQEGWGRDERYKLAMSTSDGDIFWGPENSGLDSRPSDEASADPTSDYWYCKQWPYSQWDNKWKFHGSHDTEIVGGATTVTLYLNTTNAAGRYTHFVK